jgi:hypothetical protein
MTTFAKSQTPFGRPAFSWTLPPSVKRQSNNDNLLQNKERHEKPTHKTAHLQTTRAYTQPKFAKELFSCQRFEFK